jgi:hypothetical protein
MMMFTECTVIAIAEEVLSSRSLLEVKLASLDTGFSSDCMFLGKLLWRLRNFMDLSKSMLVNR